MPPARKVCSHPRCHNLQPCPEHRRKPWEGSRRSQYLKYRSSYAQARLRAFVFERDEYRCHLCGEVYPPHKLVADHVIPLSQGGPDEPENMAPACVPCHNRKTQEEARIARGY